MHCRVQHPLPLASCVLQALALLLLSAATPRILAQAPPAEPAPPPEPAAGSPTGLQPGIGGAALGGGGPTPAGMEPAIPEANPSLATPAPNGTVCVLMARVEPESSFFQVQGTILEPITATVQVPSDPNVHIEAEGTIFVQLQPPPGRCTVPCRACRVGGGGATHGRQPLCIFD